MERNEVPRYVLDASIAVKWYVAEEESARARELRKLFHQGAIELEAPSLLRYEVASALRFHPVAKFTPTQFRTVMDSLRELQITREPTEREWTTAFALSLENSISIYDAVYISFAVHGKSRMITADRELSTRVKSQIKANLTSLSALHL